MADLLAKWLNDEIKLSMKITDFERDFSSGYLLGELLYKFNQQENFPEFSTKDNISTKVKNFEKLEPTLRNLNIKFDSQQVDKIMKQERGYALRLLYQLKMILEKVYPPTDIAILRKTGKVGDNQPALKIGSNKESYNKMQSTFFKTRLQALNKPQKTMNMENHLMKFDDEAVRQAEEAKRHAASEKEEKERIKQEIRRAQINKLQRNAGFMEEWLAKGVEDWKQNMAYKKEREQSQLEFEYKQAQKFNEITVAKISEANQEVNDGIDQFEITLKENGINPRVSKDFADKALTQTFSGNSPGKKTQKLTQSLLSRPTMGLGGTMTKTGGITLASVGLRSKAKKPLDEKARKDKERRRMRMITDQMGLLQSMEKSRHEAEILQRMKRQAKQEEELAYEAWRTNACRGIIVENRKLREAKYDKRQDLDTQNAIFKEKQMLESMQDQMAREIETLQLRDEFLREKDKEAKKSRQTVEAQKMINAIFDIAHEAYIHQQKQDSDEIDPRNWHEWEQLFVEGASITGELATPAENEDTMDQLQTLKSDSTRASTNIDHLELVDYLENKGQWPTSLVSENKPNLQELISGGGDAAPAKGKAPAKGAPADGVTLDEGDMVIGDKPENNYYVGDAVETIISLNHEARGRLLRPKNPHYLNLKLCFVGYAFAGKKLQAMKLKQEYGLDSFTLNDLVEQAIDFAKQNPNPILKESAHEESKIKEASVLQESLKEESKMASPDGENATPGEAQDAQPPSEAQKSKNLGENPMFRRSGPINADVDDDAVSVASEEEEELNPEEDFRQCGQKIQNFLIEGLEIPDQQYVDLYIAKLRMTYEYKDKKALTDAVMKDAERELELTRTLANLQEELRQMQDPESTMKKKKKRTVEIVQKEIEDQQKELSSIKTIENNGWILIDFPSNFSQAMLLEKALSGYQMAADLEPTQREIECKEAQLLTKPTEKVPPPKTLIPSGIDAVIWFDCSRDECLRRALGRRIDLKNNMIYHIQDNPPSIEQSPLCEIIAPIDDESESMACLLDRWVAFDQTKDGLKKWLTQFGDESVNMNLMAKIEASGDINSVYEQIDGILKKIVEHKEKKQLFLRSRIQSVIIEREDAEAERLRAIQEEEEARKKREEAAEGGEDAAAPVEEVKSMNKSKTSLAQKSAGSVNGSQFTADDFVHSRDNIDDDFKGVLMNLWKKTSVSYKDQMMKSLGKQRVQRENIQQFFYNVETQYLTYLKRKDGKQQVLDTFIKEFNDFSDQYPDMREDDQTKDELHQRCDILSDELWEIAEERKEAAIEERKKIMESGWVEFSLEYLTSCAQQMMQSEIDKFKGTIQLVHDYYHAIEEKLIPEAPESQTVDLIKDDVELPEVEKIAEGGELTDIASYAYPRLDDLYKRALKAQVVPDVLAASGSADAGKKGGKKDAKAAKGAPDADESKPESIYIKEMKEAIKVEKSILRFRLTQIRNWAMMRLKHQRGQSLKLYQLLDDLIQVSSKAENDAIDEVCDVVKQAIEDQTKIQDELRVNFMDFFVDKAIANFIEPPPEKLESMEEAQNSRFNIPQLKSLVQELQMIADDNKMIPNRKAVELLLRKGQNSKSLVDIGGVPKDWSSYNRNDYEKLVRNLDINNSGSIDYQVLATCCILLKSPVPKDNEIESIKRGLAQLEVDCNCIEKTPFWFDTTECAKDRDYSHPFPRTQLIKEILFNLFQENNLINVPKFTQVLKAQDYQKTGIVTYGDILTTNI